MLAKGVAAAATMAGAAASSNDMLVRGAAKSTGSLSQADQARVICDITKYGVLHTVSYMYTNTGKYGPSLESDVLCVLVDR